MFVCKDRVIKKERKRREKKKVKREHAHMPVQTSSEPGTLGTVHLGHSFPPTKITCIRFYIHST